MSFEITGKLHAIFDIMEISDRFHKREFVIEVTETINQNEYKNYIKMQLVQAKCELLDKFKIEDTIKVNFNIKGNRWEKDGKVNYITNLDAWRIELVAAETTQPSDWPEQSAPANPSTLSTSQQPEEGFNTASDTPDDLPF